MNVLEESREGFFSSCFGESRNKSLRLLTYVFILVFKGWLWAVLQQRLKMLRVCKSQNDTSEPSHQRRISFDASVFSDSLRYPDLSGGEMSRPFVAVEEFISYLEDVCSV